MLTGQVNIINSVNDYEFKLIQEKYYISIPYIFPRQPKLWFHLSEYYVLFRLSYK